MGRADERLVSLVALLDLSAAFDTLDHLILLKRLDLTFGIKDLALSWFRSYPSDRYQYVIINGVTSEPSLLQYGVPQGSVLGPILFILYTQPLAAIINHHSLSHHSFSDDNQLHASSHPDP